LRRNSFEFLQLVLVIRRSFKMSASPKKKERRATRYGPMSQSNVSFAKEERFAWQKAKFASDVVYAPKLDGQARPIVFGGALRGSNDDNPDAKKRSTGPGSYDIQHAPKFLSMYLNHNASRFATAARQSMDMKTPSPGAVYNIEKVYWNGPDTGKAISFNCDKRRPLYDGEPTDADMVWPALPKKPGITMAKRIARKEKGSDTPGAHYKIVEKWSGPSFSFGKGRGNRFTNISILRGFES
jgi:hypothetical protein